ARFRSRLERDRRGESVAKAHALDLEVPIDERGFLGQRDLRLRVRVEHAPEQITQRRDRLYSGFAVAGPDQRSDGVQAVEQEVRMQLRRERLELRLAQLRFELR